MPYGKIIGRMLAPKVEEKVSPPRIIPSLVEGFNAVAGRIYLIIFPILIDLILWFGSAGAHKELAPADFIAGNRSFRRGLW